MMDVTVEIHCGACGSANYSLAGDAAAASDLHCNDCGRKMGSLAELQAEMLDQVLTHSAEALRRDARGAGEGEAA